MRMQVNGVIFVFVKLIDMEIIFDKEYLRDLYITGKADKKHRFQPQIIRKYIRFDD